MTTAPNASPGSDRKQLTLRVVSNFQLLEDDSMAMCYLPDDLCVA
ncbi:MAG: hypothetical protein ACON4H_18950 [Rubripirellula sp.]